MLFRDKVQICTELHDTKCIRIPKIAPIAKWHGHFSTNGTSGIRVDFLFQVLAHGT